MDKYNKRYTLNEVKEIFISNGYTPIFNTYKTNKEKLLCQSIKDGYKGFIRLNSLLNGQKIAWFHQSNPYTIDNIKKFIINNKLDCELISQEWISSYNDLEFKCLICDKIFNMPWNTFSEGNTKFCQECTNRRLGSDKRHDFDFIFNEFVKKGYYPMFNSYVDNKEKLLVKDKEGYFGLISYHQLSSNHGFDKFHPKNPYTYKNIENYIKNNNLECKFITGIYKNNESKLTFRCGCGEYFTTSWAIFSNLNKTRCDSCSKVKSKLELKTSEWLDLNNCDYVSQYTFPLCKNKLPLPFDFCVSVKDNVILIECQGIQHFKPIEFFGGLEGLAYRTHNDSIKRKYCIDNNIKLLEISYKDFNNNNYISILRKEILS